MIVTYPWPAPSANVDPAGLATGVAAAHLPDPPAEESALRPSQVEELVCWTRRERLRLLWYRLRLAAGVSYRHSRRARKPRLSRP
jgi:hypothetical protein